ncbi:MULTISPECIES: tripartite tricarboxylate transporter substrate binding protein [unclassified Beijerinckia]|uniref:Bug family tripartite tricarboxylate transporter substrate binding protein n=1 Tax=unclassified Beijerinckia TaxID=2638183 RepID=UPI0008992B86|nr:MULTISPECIES: tripartite tricarboxylate transporter substrate binding protein [unclassified Beijerinckia]MDH7794691.1 tripartite-type tricarboxylate transporter receptor subunit TctC [Beijerinckia sp. GAS462]SEB71404.1 Tripartite-type tricarboxylate transporter, receptor component TctC [Beijerinckia sp. 28-YEA-48]
MNIRQSFSFGLVLAAAGLSTTAWADTYPRKPIVLVVPYAAGGPADTAARLLSEPFGKEIGERVVIENKVGGGGTLAATSVKGGTADGYTLLMAGEGPMSINPHVQKNIPYNPATDFVPAAVFASGGCNVLVVNPKFAAATLKDFVALARSKSGEVMYGGSGLGTPAETVAIEFQASAGAKMQKVPYTGSGPAFQDVIGGHLDALFVSAVSAVSAIEAGTVRALGVSTAKRCDVLPNVPTFREGGVDLDTGYYWFGIFARTGTPQDIIEKLNGAINRATASPGFADSLKIHSLAPQSLSVTEAAAYVRRDMDEWAQKIERLPQIKQ